ncbi:hypothetical protein [Devosia submarina]|uniref:hypothetical protein n=1 Tax=Devosia submarina TaxID=1173082 RepID=UPI000D38D77C|nr:hypothetical protein [Devosia submarina]
MKHWTPNKSGSGGTPPETGLKQPNPNWKYQSFGLMGPSVLANGWSIFPQHHGDDFTEEKREPGTPHGAKKIAYKGYYKLHQQLPLAETVKHWSDNKGVRDLNIAGVTGDTAGTHGWFTADVDVYDHVKMRVISEIAAETLGWSPLRRGRPSVAKEAWIYRRPIGKLNLPKRFVFESLFEGKDEAIEILDDGAPITFFGFHHKTGEFFEWPERSPYNSSPDCAPITDEDGVLEFLRRVHAVYPFKDFEKLLAGKGIAADFDYVDTDVSDIRTPAISEAKLSASPLTGGRRQEWLLPRSVSWATFNAGIVAPLSGDVRQVSGEGVSRIARAMAREAIEYTNYSETEAYSKARELIRSAAVKLVDGRFKPKGTQRKVQAADGSVVVVSKDRHYPECRDPELSWLPPAAKRAGVEKDEETKRTLKWSLSPSDAELAKARELIGNREAIRTGTSRKVRLAIRGWLIRTARWNPESGKPAPRLLIKAPTGAGKTTALLQELVRFKKRGGKIGPILMLLPSYENTSELEARQDLGVWTKAQEERANEIKAELKNAGDLIRVMTFKGKLAAGCEFPEITQKLMAKRYSTAGMCKAKDPSISVEDENGKRVPKTVYCRFNPENSDFVETAEVRPCQAILQKLEVPQHDLILAPHAFIQTNIPAALKNVAAVVIDEKIWDKCLGSYTFGLAENLTRGRAAPKPLDSEEAAGLDTIEYVFDRGWLTDLVIPAVRQGKDVAEVILDHRHHYTPEKSISGDGLLAHTRAVTGRNQGTVLDVMPGVEMAVIDRLCSTPEAIDIVEEHKFWTVIQERVDALMRDRELLKTYNLHMKLFEETKPRHGVDLRKSPKPPVLEVTNDRDRRIIYLAGADDQVTVVWRKKRNFESLPTLFLDASGRKEILEKIWGGTIRTVTVNAPLHLRTVLVPDFGQSKTSIIPSQDDNAETLLAKAELQTLNREAIYTLGLMHGDSAVVACAAKGVRSQLNSGWAAPANTHFMHFGAVRGLDFAKFYGAAVSIGSVTPRDTDIDAYVAALSYDDDEPEALNDPHGNGRVSADPSSAKIKRRYIDRPYPLRDGGTALVTGIHEYEGAWARMLQQQIREEELGQFVGRLRPVYREGEAPVWYVLGKVLPDGIIVDDIISLRDLARPTGRSTRAFRMVKEAGGVVTEAGHKLLNLYQPHASDAAVQKLGVAFAGNPRMRRGFHEITYTIEGSHDEFRGWVFAGDGAEPVEHFEKVMGILGPKTRTLIRMPIVKTARLARFARLKDYGQPTKQHEIDVVLGSLQERGKADAKALAEVGKMESDKQIKFDEKRLGIIYNGKAIDPDTYAAFMGFRKAMAEADKACEETEVKSEIASDWTIEPANDGSSEQTRTAVRPLLKPDAAPFQVFFGTTPAVHADSPVVVPAPGLGNVVPFPRRIGARPRTQAPA